MSSPIKEFMHLGERVILLPGKRFSKKELILRLDQMNVQYQKTSNTKKYYEDLYENAIKYDVNKIKIFDKLFKDTGYYYNNLKGSKININQNSISHPVHNNNTKVAIIQNHVVKQEISDNDNNINNRPVVFDKNMSFHTSILSESNNINNNFNMGNNQNNQINYNNYNNNHNNNQFTFKESLMNEIKKSQNQLNHQRPNQSQNNNSFNQGQNQINYEYNPNLNYNQQNNYNINTNQHNIPNQSQYNNYNQKNINYNYNQNQQNFHNNMNNYINQSQINQEYQNYNNQKNNRTPEYNYNNDIKYKYERKNCIIEKEPQEINNEAQTNDNMNTISLSIRNAMNNNYQNPQFQNGQNFDNSGNLQNNSNFRQRPILSNNNQIITNDIEEDVQSNFSFSSHYERIKNYLSNKDNLDFLLKVLQFIMVGIILLFLFKYGLRFSRATREMVTERAKVLTDPKKLLINIIWGIIKGILVGVLWKYLYLSLPFAVISYIAYQIKEKINFNNTCKKIIEDIKNDLSKGPLDKNGRRTISEKEIKSKYSKKYNIDYNTFDNKYLKELKKMRSNDHSLKEYPVQGDTCWHGQFGIFL